MAPRTMRTARVGETALRTTLTVPTNKREAEEESSSRDVKPKFEQLEEDVKPKVEQDIKPKLKQDVKPKVERDVKPSLSIVKDVPLEWLKLVDPKILQKLVLQACSTSPKLNDVVSSSIAEYTSFTKGDGPVKDFKVEVAKMSALVEHWYEGEVWEDIESGMRGFAKGVSPTSSAATKINALNAIYDLLEQLAQAIAIGGRNHDLAAADFAGELAKVLEKMNDMERRSRIDAKLVKKLDQWVDKKRHRSLYGKEGRDVGDNRWDRDDDEEDESEEE